MHSSEKLILTRLSQSTLFSARGAFCQVAARSILCVFFVPAGESRGRYSAGTAAPTPYRLLASALGGDFNPAVFTAVTR
jgi:hypothetical protein